MSRRIAARALTALLVVTAGLLATTACQTETERFCDSLRSRYRMSGLVAALDAANRPVVERELRSLQRLQGLAPKAIRDDFRQIVDAVIDTIRAVFPATSPGGDTAPVDIDSLNAALAEIRPAAQRVGAYADRNCGFTLDG